MELLEGASIEIKPNLEPFRFEKMIFPNLQESAVQTIRGDIPVSQKREIKPVPQLSERDAQLLKQAHRTRNLINQLANGIGNDL